MLIIRLNSGWGLKLGRKVGESGGCGIWEFHRSESSYSVERGRRTYRYARIKPADPAEGKTVEIVLLEMPNSPEEQWIARGEGVASIHPDY